MYLEEINPVNCFSTTLVKIQYDCCEKQHTLKWCDANKNYLKNKEKHICRLCWLKTNNPAKLESTKKTMKETNIKKYGVSCPLNTPEKIALRNEKFKDKEFLDKWNKKHQATCLEKYGVEHHMKSDISKENQKQTMLEKYGVEHPYQSKEIMDKMKQSNMKKYEVENVSQILGTQEKVEATTFKNYGVKRYNELPEMKEYLKKNCRQWLAESWANPWTKGCTRKKEWNDKQRETVANLIQEGKWMVGDKYSQKGKYKSTKCINSKEPIFRSSYELKVHIWLDNNDEVESYEYEPFMIEYYDTDNHKRYYFPDFAVKFTDKIQILEIKNDYALKLPTNIKKEQYLKLICDKNNLDYKIWSNKQIENLNIDIENYKNRYTSNKNA